MGRRRRNSNKARALGRPAENLIGQRFERLVVIKRAGSDKWNRARWLVQCDCGVKSTVVSTKLKRGNTRSCGCLRDELNVKLNTTHGHSTRSREYTSWQSMRDRVLNPNHVAYKNYGGAGVSICKRWDRFENFLADMGSRPPSKTLDRKNPYGNYNKRNCRWATPKEQANNRGK